MQGHGTRAVDPRQEPLSVKVNQFDDNTKERGYLRR